MKLKYEFSQDEVNYLLNAVNRSQFAGVEGAKNLLHITQLLKIPLNIEEFEKENTPKQEEAKQEKKK
jgi:hypothetical protein